jgi:competence protein ComEA
MSRTCFPAPILVLALLVCCSTAVAKKGELPQGPGKEVMVRLCGQCHAPDLAIQKGNTRDGWTQVVGEMIARGAQGSDDEFATVVDYLTTNFPPKGEVKKVNVNKAEAPELQTALALEQKDATAIVDYRKKNGDFKTLDDLKKVPGIDAAKLDTAKEKISF